MTVAALCLKCPSDVDQIEPAVKKVLVENYPEDRAIGYQIDDFLGVIWISIPAKLIKQ